MKFDRAALSEAVGKALDCHLAEWLASQKQIAAKLADDRAEWVEQHAEAWRATVKKVNARLRKGEPIYRQDMPGGVGNIPLYYEHRSYQPADPASYQAPEQLLVLAQVLRTLADEHVTTSGLRDLGVTPATLRCCIVHLAKGSTHA